MRYVISLIVLIGSVALSAPMKSGYLIKTNLTYKSIKGRPINSTKEFVLPSDNHKWLTLTEFNEGVVLLGRMIKADRKSIHMEYLLVDGNKKPNGVISTPSIISNLNETAEVSVGGNNNSPDLSISLLAKETTFSVE
jgi:hypothetical protein